MGDDSLDPEHINAAIRARLDALGLTDVTVEASVGEYDQVSLLVRSGTHETNVGIDWLHPRVLDTVERLARRAKAGK